MSRRTRGIFRTSRLRIRPAAIDDVELIYSLWTDPRVMQLVGFPNGIPTSQEEIRAQIERDADRHGIRLLIAEREPDEQPIGQCKLGAPDQDGVCEPDVKLLPAFWRQGYGRELWGGMIDFLFVETGCLIVQGTPNTANTASIRMMESCEMTHAGEGVFQPPMETRDVTVPVPHYVYRTSCSERQPVQPDS